MEIPNWIKKRYLRLLDYFKNRPFSFKEVYLFLKDNYSDSEDQVKIILSEINKASLLEISSNPQDKRESIYKLKPLINFKKNYYSPTKDQLLNLLKQAADIIRTRIDYSFILLLLFYKAYSDKWEKEYEEKKEELLLLGWSQEEAVKEASEGPYHTFEFPKEFLWNNLRNQPQKISERFSLAMKKLAELNPNFQDIFSQFDFYPFISNPENTSVLNQLIEIFSKFSFKEIKSDILGDAYEWLLKYFAPTKAKEGEVYTPREVIRLMIELIDPKPEKSLYDPALGSGGMLIVAYNYVKEKYGQDNADSLFLFGQEFNQKTLALAKMNMLLHNIRNFNLALGDTLIYPKFKEDDKIQKFDYVIANPPWNQDGYDEESLKKAEYFQERFVYGFATKQSADWMWIQHMIASCNNDGKIVVVIDTGAVSRGGREKTIREKIIKENLIESVILLPEKLFYNTQAPAVIIVLNKNKPEEKKNKILLINASKEFQPGKKQNTLSKENIERIVKVYREFKEVEGFSKIVTLEEAKEADYNLSPSRFVMAIEEEEYRPISEIKADLEKLEEERGRVEKKLIEILRKI